MFLYFACVMSSSIINISVLCFSLNQIASLFNVILLTIYISVSSINIITKKMCLLYTEILFT